MGLVRLREAQESSGCGGECERGLAGLLKTHGMVLANRNHVIAMFRDMLYGNGRRPRIGVSMLFDI